MSKREDLLEELVRSLAKSVEDVTVELEMMKKELDKLKRFHLSRGDNIE